MNDSNQYAKYGSNVIGRFTDWPASLHPAASLNKEWQQIVLFTSTPDIENKGLRFGP
jgi:hypothetical protein